MDMLIKLYGQEVRAARFADFEPALRKPVGAEHRTIAAWIGCHFGAVWASESEVALNNRPSSLLLAVQEETLLGFACYDATARGFFGPIGVAEEARGKGIGRALLLACLHDMRTMGYGYAVAGDVGAPEFFRRVAGAVEIPDSTPGIYAGMLR